MQLDKKRIIDKEDEDSKKLKQQKSTDNIMNDEDENTQEISSDVVEKLKKEGTTKREKVFKIKLVEDPYEKPYHFGEPTKLILTPGIPTILGRSKHLHIKDKRISIQQLQILQPSATDDYCVLTMLGRNPSTIQREGTENYILVRGGQSKEGSIINDQRDYAICAGDKISLLVTLYGFVLKVKEQRPATEGSNYLFYKGDIPSKPHGDYIDVIHKKWFGDYTLLERHHGYVQWLFPLFEGNGMNFHSKRLKKEEAKLMREDLNIAKRYVKTYQLMLDFYGIELANPISGELKRAKHWKERYDNLEAHPHNNLRITRIITSLGHLGFSRWKKPLVDFLTTEIEDHHELTSCVRPLRQFWIPSLDVNSPQFKLKTGETDEDRTDSIYFSQFK